MRFPALNRKVHYWASLVAAAPLLVITVTGVLLQFKKQWAWVQPPERRGTAGDPLLTPAALLAACRGVPEAGVRGWADVARVDLRPARGVYKVTARTNWEVQIDARTGAVLQVAYRRSDLLEAVHDGAWFSDAVKWLVFFPAGLLLLLLWATGAYLLWLPYAVRRRRARAARAGVQRPGEPGP